MNRGSTRLTSREREIVALLGQGMSGAEIATHLVVSPETVRTHIRNAMRKLGATTRSQAVVLAFERGEIGGRGDGPKHATDASGSRVRRPSDGEVDRALERMLATLAALPDVEAAIALVAEDDGLGLRRAAVVTSNAEPPRLPARLALGEGALGKVALNRRAVLLPNVTGDAASQTAALAAPILDNGHLLGVLALAIRPSRPARQSELLVLRALANRVAEILRDEDDPAPTLEQTAERFAASWSAASA